MAEARATFRAQFAELSAEALKENGEKFLDTAKRVFALQHQTAENDLTRKQEEISLIKPIEESIKAVSEATREMKSNRATAFGSIEERLKQSIASAAEVAKQAGDSQGCAKETKRAGKMGRSAA